MKSNHILLPDLIFSDVWRFWNKVKKSEIETDCWLWEGAIANHKPIIKINGVNYGASRIAWKIYHGTDPKELLVCHHCHPNKDNPLCVKKEHLWLGTVHENNQDSYDKGRISLPDGNWKLSDSEINEMRLMKERGFSDIKIAKKFNCTRQHVWMIVTNRIRPKI